MVGFLAALSFYLDQTLGSSLVELVFRDFKGALRRRLSMEVTLVQFF